MSLHYFRPMEYCINFGRGKSKQVIANAFAKGQVRGLAFDAVAAVLLGDEVEYVDERGYDFISKGSGKKIEVRTVLNNGQAVFAPSSNYGKGRKIDYAAFAAEAEEKDYFLAETVMTSSGVKYRATLIPGSMVREEGPNWSSVTVKTVFNNLKDDNFDPVRGW